MLACTGLTMVPIIAYALGRRLKPVVAAVMMASAALAVCGSLTVSTYSAAMPKRLLLSHVNRLAPEGANSGVMDLRHSRAPGGGEALAVYDAAYAVGGVDSTSIDVITSGMNLTVLEDASFNGFTVLFPLTFMAQKRLFKGKEARALTPDCSATAMDVALFYYAIIIYNNDVTARPSPLNSARLHDNHKSAVSTNDCGVFTSPKLEMHYACSLGAYQNNSI